MPGAGLGMPSASQGMAAGGDVAARMQLLLQIYNEGFMGADEYSARRAQLEQQQQLQQQSMAMPAAPQQNPLEILTMYFTRGLITAEDYQARLALLQQQQQPQMLAPAMGLGMSPVGMPAFGIPSQLPAFGAPVPTATSLHGLGPGPLGGPGLSAPAPAPMAQPSNASTQLAQLQQMLETGLITQDQYNQYVLRTNT